MSSELIDMTVAIGSDHAGYLLKDHLKKYLASRQYHVIDVGTDSDTPIDYPPFCIAVGEAVATRRARFGIVLGGSGQGEQIAANKVRGVRAALCNSPQFSLYARRDNDANVLALGARIIAPEQAELILATWLSTDFVAGRHKRRIDLISAYDESR